jgi:ATP-binding cassette subfamily G (WHITE) protein 2
MFTYELPRQLVLTLIYTVITVYISGLKRTAEAVFTYWAINFLTLLIGEALAVAVSAVSKNSTEANMLLSLAVYLWMFFTPFFTSHVPKGLSWLNYTSFFRW